VQLVPFVPLVPLPAGHVPLVVEFVELFGLVVLVELFPLLGYVVFFPGAVPLLLGQMQQQKDLGSWLRREEKLEQVLYTWLARMVQV
jgi:hypothetical protein